MKINALFSLAVLVSLCATVNGAPLGTSFSYQGRLSAGAAAFTGNAEFEATLWDTAAEGEPLATNSPAQVIVGVSNGLFVLPLDFGVSPFSAGEERWLGLKVRTTIGPFVELSPRQPLAPAPFAITAVNLSGPLPASGLTGSYSNAVTFTNAANKFSGNGTGLTNVNARTLQGLSATNLWQTAGNTNMIPGTNFLGTIDNRPLEVRVHKERALRLEPTAGAPNIIGGAEENLAAEGITGATIGGGQANEAGGSFATVGGGQTNVASGANSTIPGGSQNVALGTHSFAAGVKAHANSNGSFVWSSVERTDSWGPATFTVRAHGGVRFYTASGAGTGVSLTAGAGGWSTLSDRDAKENFEPIDARAVLEKVVAMPVSTWNLKSQPASTRHIGPMAQDFAAAFGLGEDDRHINTVDADGVALAAIQGLNLKLENSGLASETRARNLEAQLREKETEIEQLKSRLERLEALLPVAGLENAPARQ